MFHRQKDGGLVAGMCFGVVMGPRVPAAVHTEGRRSRCEDVLWGCHGTMCVARGSGMVGNGSMYVARINI